MTEAYDFLLVGHGIAGATLARALRRRGQRVCVYDAPRPNAASRVAAGLMNPVAGKRFALSWRAAELFPFALAYYRELEAELGQNFLVETPILKVFGSAEEARQLAAKAALDPWQGFVEKIEIGPLALAGVRAPHGGSWLRGGGHVLVRELLAALAAEGQAQGWLRAETFSWEHLVSDATGVTYAPGQLRARRVVCCEGAAAAENPYFSWLPLTPNQGEVLTVDCPGLSRTQVLNRGAYVVPLPGAESAFRVGATYRWPPFATAGPTPAGTAELSARLADLTPRPFAVREAQAGVRPAVRDRRPLLGPHPAAGAWLSFCGGYGSKGVSVAPRLAAHLADWLLGEVPALWPEVSLARYHALYPPAGR